MSVVGYEPGKQRARIDQLDAAQSIHSLGKWPTFWVSSRSASADRAAASTCRSLASISTSATRALIPLLDLDQRGRQVGGQSLHQDLGGVSGEIELLDQGCGSRTARIAQTGRRSGSTRHGR